MMMNTNAEDCLSLATFFIKYFIYFKLILFTFPQCTVLGSKSGLHPIDACNRKQAAAPPSQLPYSRCPDNWITPEAGAWQRQLHRHRHRHRHHCAFCVLRSAVSVSVFWLSFWVRILRKSFRNIRRNYGRHFRIQKLQPERTSWLSAFIRRLYI